ncbi:hypothetical protein [Desulfolithobacter dissulfuricans]|nr:hypothetical protein [Desulfolithobacter dissulfuricans]
MIKKKYLSDGFFEKIIGWKRKTEGAYGLAVAIMLILNGIFADPGVSG